MKFADLFDDPNKFLEHRTITLTINSKSNTTFSGPTSAIYEHRKLLENAFFYSNYADDMLWDYLSNPSSTYALKVTVKGFSINDDTGAKHPYKQHVHTDYAYGGEGIQRATRDLLYGFKSIKSNFGAPGYSPNGFRLILTGAEVTPIEIISRGGSNFPLPGCYLIGPNLIVREPSKRLQFGDLRDSEADPLTNNNCAFRAVYQQLQPRSAKDAFKRAVNLKTIRKEFGIPADSRLTPEEIIKICASRNINLTVKVVSGLDPNTARVSEIKSDFNGVGIYGITIILHTDVGHYYMPLGGKFLPNERKVECHICGDKVKAGDMNSHIMHHDVRKDFTSNFNLPIQPIDRLDGEDYATFSKRYADHYMKILDTFLMDVCARDKVLWFAGPGGCGKSFVINKFREKNPNLKIQCLSKTGVAAQNIGGITMDSYYFRIKELPDVIIVDEISMSSFEEIMKLNDVLKKMAQKLPHLYGRRSHLLFAGVRVIFMGDQLQLQSFGDSTPLVYSEFFTEHVIAVPMLYGHRYERDPSFYDLLLQLRSSYMDRSDFLNAGFKMIKEKEWVENFTPEERPTMLVFTNKERRRLEERARTFDLQDETREVYHIKIDLDKVVFDRDGEELETELSKFTGFKKGRFIPLDSAPSVDMIVNKNLDSGFDCDINVTKTTFYVGERLMLLQNYCAVSIDGDKTLMNGDEVIFVSINEGKMLVEKNGEQYAISRVYRGGKYKSEYYVATGYPIQSAMVSTVHKAQGKTYTSVVVSIPLPNDNPIKHLYYVAISRCVSSSNVYFMLHSTNDVMYTTREEGLMTVYKRLYDPKGTQNQLVAQDKYMVKLMKYTETGGPISAFPDIDVFGLERDVIEFPNEFTTRSWNLDVPNQLKSLEEHRRFLGKDILLFDIETGAAVGSENHPLFYNDNGELIDETNGMRHDQTPWLFSFLHIKGWKIVWLHSFKYNGEIPYEDRQFLEELSQHQDRLTGIVHITLTTDDNGYCSRTFTRYLMIMASYVERCKTEATADKQSLSRYARQPMTLVGFNIDGFDSKSILNRLCKDQFPEHFHLHIIPNSGTAITKLTLNTDNQRNIGDLVTTHDVFRLLGCCVSLARCHETFMVKPYGEDKEKYRAYCSEFTKDPVLIHNLVNHLEKGKGEFPHLLTQREGYKALMTFEPKEYKLEDFLPKDRSSVKNKEDRTFVLGQKAIEYMNGDIYVLLGTYLGVNDMVYNECKVPTLQLNTAQQFTSANLMYCGSDVDGLIRPRKVDFPYETRTFVVSMSLPNVTEQKIIDLATYGGKTTPRVTRWDSENGEGSYTQLDESGMYADAQQSNFYPYGPHYNTTLQKYTDAVMNLWRIIPREQSDRFKDPVGTHFPYYFIAHVIIKVPSLCPDPFLPFINNKDQLDWGICNDDTEDGTREQFLCNIHLATLKCMGGELLEVKRVMFWENYGPVYNRYLTRLNTTKYTTKDELLKQGAKLNANASYGAALKRDHDTVYAIVSTPDMFSKLLSRIDRQNIIDSRVLPNGRYAIQGYKENPLKTHSSRPTYQGVFVLAHSQYKLAKMTIVGFGETYFPETVAQVREGLRFQPLYGDTDSSFVHETHINRLLRHADATGERFLHDHTLRKDPLNPTNEELLDQLGKYCDEVANDNKMGHMVNFREGKFSKVLRFAASGPKAYTATYQTLDGKIISKNRLKGIKEGSTMALVTSSSESKKRSLDDSDDTYGKKSARTADMMFRAITTGEDFIATKATRTLKNFGLTPQPYERSYLVDGSAVSREAFTYSVTNVTRDVLGQVLTRRRPLTDEEVSFLSLNEYDASRIRVPHGWNWDGSLFKLT